MDASPCCGANLKSSGEVPTGGASSLCFAILGRNAVEEHAVRLFGAVPMNPYVGVLKESHRERSLGARNESDAPESEEGKGIHGVGAPRERAAAHHRHGAVVFEKVVAAKRSGEAEVGLYRVHRPHCGNQQKDADDHAEQGFDGQRAGIGDRETNHSEWSGEQQRKEDDPPDDESSITEDARDERMAQLTSPDQSYRHLLYDRHEYAGKKPDAFAEPEPLTTVEGGRRYRPDAGEQRGEEKKVRQLPPPQVPRWDRHAERVGVAVVHADQNAQNKSRCAPRSDRRPTDRG